MTEQRSLIEQLIALARREHFTCEDSFYNCPLSAEGSPIDAYAGTCMCGADKHNAEVERIAAAISAVLMTEQRAREILGEAIQEDGNLMLSDLKGGRSLYYVKGSERSNLRNIFTLGELEAIVFWMRRHAT